LALEYQYQPQLALRVSDDKIPLYHRNDGYASDIKLDGVRYILHYDLDGTARAYSRGFATEGGRRSNLLVDKSGQLIHLLEDLKKFWPPGTVLDGEVFIPGVKKSFKHVTPVTGATPDNARRYQLAKGQWVQYYAFDIIAEGGQDYTWAELGLSQEDRWERLKATFGTDKQIGNLHLCQPVYGTDAKSGHLKRCLDMGFEGVIYKQLEGLYVPDKRDNRWVKDKPQREFQVVCMGVEWANLTSVKKGDLKPSPTRFVKMAKEHGLERIVGSIIYGQFARCTGLIVEGDTLLHRPDGFYELRALGKCSGIDDATRLDITKKWQDYVANGRCFDIRAQNRHEETLALREPQFDRWRDELNPINCIVRDDE
jgi:hypothetical protein